MIVWIDLETTGLNPRKDSLLEVAVLVTDDELNRLGSYEAVIATPKRKLKRLDDYVRSMHSKSGLLDDLPTSTITLSQAEAEITALLDDLGCVEKVILGGNSVHFDRGFLDVTMPNLMKRFSHQHLDVSAIGLVVKRWHKEVYDLLRKERGEVEHRAKDDINACVATLRRYRELVFADESKAYLVETGNN